MKKKSGGKGDEGHGGGSERWLLTYADMITLLMAFFIMMYSMSVVNLAKFRQAAISIKSGFGGIVKGQGASIMNASGQVSVRPSPIPGDTTGVAWQIIKPMQVYINKAPYTKDFVRVYTDRRGIVVSLLSDKILFEPGSADIKPEALPLVSRIAEVIRPLPNEVRVEGHTCNLATKSDVYPSNWELSTARAATVVRYFIDSQKVSAKRLSAAGYADTRPVAANDTEEHRRVNRRVDFIILKPSEEQRQ
jgi:chemotaxis protein MotB